MNSRGLGVVMAMLLAGCAPPPAPEAPPRPPPATPPPTPEEPCVPEGPHARLPGDDIDEFYDELEALDKVDPYADEDGPYQVGDPKAEARRAYNAGRRAAKERRWDAALEHFRESWGHRKHPLSALGAADAAIQLGRHRDALRYIEFVLASKRIDNALRTRAEAWQAESLTKVARLRILTTPEGACVLLDGLVVGHAPLAGPVVVDAGEHRPEARYHGESATTSVSVAAQGTAEVTLNTAKTR